MAPALQRALKRGNKSVPLGHCKVLVDFLAFLRLSLGPGTSARYQSRPCLMLHNSSLPAGGSSTRGAGAQ